MIKALINKDADISILKSNNKQYQEEIYLDYNKKMISIVDSINGSNSKDKEPVYNVYNERINILVLNNMKILSY